MTITIDMTDLPKTWKFLTEDEEAGETKMAKLFLLIGFLSLAESGDSEVPPLARLEAVQALCALASDALGEEDASS